jgi:hypothetical protein
VGCTLPALSRYTWPGRDESFICPIHEIKLRAVAKAIGLQLQIVPLTPAELVNEEP